MNITSNEYTSVLGPRSDEIVDQIRATIYKLRKQPFLGWSIPRLTIEELNSDTLTEFVVAMQNLDMLPVPPWFPVTDTINDAAAKVFAQWRSFFELDSEGRERTVPHNPISRPTNVEGGQPSAWQGFDIYRDEQYMTTGHETDHSAVDLPVDLSMLTETELSILAALGDGHTQYEVAVWHGWVEGAQKADHRAWVQSKLRTIRRKVCGEGVRTQKQALAWLEALLDV